MINNLKCKRLLGGTVALLLWVLMPSNAVATDTGTDPDHKHAWGENVGWVSAHSANHDVTVRFDGDAGWLSGFAWGGNIGWIKMGSDAGGPYANTTADNWGVNLSSDGKLSGYAWGENVGWINFEQTYGHPAINTTSGEFSGHAWGGNIGWVSLRGISPDYGVRTLAFDTQPMGTPNWWLGHHGVTEDHDAGDGVAAWKKYVMDTDPNVVGDVLWITSVSNAVGGTDVRFVPASTRRYYTLVRRESLTGGAWSNVTGQVAVPGTGGEQGMLDGEALPHAFYRVRVTVSP